MADLSSKIASLHSRISKEHKILEGFQAMRSATSNQDVIRTCDAKIREAQKTIGWFEQSLHELQQRAGAGAVAGAAGAAAAGQGVGGVGGAHSPVQQQQHNSQRGASSMGRAAGYGNRPGANQPYTGGAPGGRDLPAPPPGAMPTYLQHQYGQGSIGGTSGRGDDARSEGVIMGEGTAVAKVHYSSLDLIKADTPLNTAKISRMLHQLEFKLHVERQYKEGIDKMAKLYLMDGDKKARADTENKRVESRQKMVLLSQALKRYKTLDVMGELGEDDDGISEDVKNNIRRPLSGALQITIRQARDLAHAPQPKKSKHSSETVIYVKVEDTPRARTHPSKTDRWNEDFEIHVDKANEVEVTIYDRIPGAEAPQPIGMLWLRLSDIVEELRRRKTGAEAGPGWVTAARVNAHPGSGGHLGAAGMDQPVVGEGSAANRALSYRGAGGEFGQAGGASEGIDAWFAVEPEGAIMLHLNFVKSNVRKRPYDAGGLGRQGAVRKRKEEVHEQNGHQFVQKQFYAVVLCALCGEFLLKGAGMQCEDCKYACHKNCYQKVVTKCISKSNADSEKDEEQINHRIPHRFEPITNISPNWCAHCGLVLPLGRKHARKCSEPNCGITAHAECVHLVPDFCGMSMVMANQLLSDIKKINDAKSGARRANQAVAPRPGRVAGTGTAQPSPYAQSTTTVGTAPVRRSESSSNAGYGAGRPPQQQGYRPSEELAGEMGRVNLQGGAAPPSTSRPPQSAGPAAADYSSYGQQPVYGAGEMQQQQQPTAYGQNRTSAQASSPVSSTRQSTSSTSTIASFGNDLQGSSLGSSDPIRGAQQLSQQQQSYPGGAYTTSQYTSTAPTSVSSQHSLGSYGQQQLVPQQPQPSSGYDAQRDQYTAPSRYEPVMQSPSQYTSSSSSQTSTRPSGVTTSSSSQAASQQSPSPQSRLPPFNSEPRLAASAQQQPPQQQGAPKTPQQQLQQQQAEQYKHLRELEEREHQKQLQQQRLVQQQQQAPPQQPQRAYEDAQMTPDVSSLPPVPPQSSAVRRGPQPPVTMPAPLPVAAPSRRRIGLDDFNFLAVLGKGNFGKVMLAEEKVSSQLYAIKVLKKEFIIENDEVESTKSEKRVFLAAARERHPFLLGLHSCFQTETRIYFVMEYISGGDLMLHIQREQFTPRRAKFYAAEVLLALEYFHTQGIVYRDLKLDNILLTLDGHIKVADYGLCKEDMWFGKTTSTFCGTPEFMAPEIILEQRYGRAVDWWAFGVLIYEMLLGQSPFRGDDEDEIFDAILEDEPLYPIHMPKDSVSILQKLLTRDPTRRLGAGESDAAEIKAHLFFKDTNWDDIFHKRVPSPFFPNITSATDTSNFDSEFTKEQPTLTPVHSTLSAQDQGEFAGFSWTAAWVPN
ncbi:AGC/PKC protein kinase [Microbotryum lychnidis-dioicae p1A1 Lamole]|uniref:protein kinase C n=1 Tax=Microbotryum lychnidis-dioicae (strain p1A1 Lamole / MvSl-1064) TaxID=683840 RepID=U5H1I8_USTV1|nr:AGC/PKC protein kinase [Microbotryum lychnidis-dioicae p1A1 Lamole]|eukprot:KDE08462.1 AGC/PKC protein kinase [Microbotryum lychnidis-dioicae p1A1 Lamole]